MRTFYSDAPKEILQEALVLPMLYSLALVVESTVLAVVTQLVVHAQKKRKHITLYNSSVDVLGSSSGHHQKQTTKKGTVVVELMESNGLNVPPLSEYMEEEPPTPTTSKSQSSQMGFSL